MTTIVFLHIPKTAGQTIHNQLASVIGKEAVSPIRIHSQAPDESHLPPGYMLYSGHIDWADLAELNGDRFVFSVLRDPRERVASFYFYLLNKAQKAGDADLEGPQNAGMRAIRNRSADDYFFGGNAGWEAFVRNHYDNFYCTYLATRRMVGKKALLRLGAEEILTLAVDGSEAIDRVYSVDNLAKLEDDLEGQVGKRLRIAGHYTNTGTQSVETRRWPTLLARFGRDSSRRRIEDFVTLDLTLLERLKAGRHGVTLG